MASMLNLPNPETDKPILAEVHQPDIDASVFKRGDLKSTGDGQVALAQGLAAYGTAQTNREISSIQNSAAIGQAAMGGLAQMAGKLKQQYKAEGGDDKIAYQVNPQSGEMTAVGPGQPFSGASSIFSGGTLGDSLLGGFFDTTKQSGNYSAPTTETPEQRPVATPGQGGTTGAGSVAMATVTAGPEAYRNQLEGDLQKIAQENVNNPKVALEGLNSYLARNFEFSSELGKPGLAAHEHATNYAGHLYRGISETYTKNKLKSDYNDLIASTDGLANNIYSTARSYTSSGEPKQSFDDWFANSPQWKQINDNVASVVNNPALNTDFGQYKGSAYLDGVKDNARQQWAIGKAEQIKDRDGYDSAYNFLEKEILENPSSSLTPEQKQSAFKAGLNQINHVTEQQKTSRSAFQSTMKNTLEDIRLGGFGKFSQKEILDFAAASRKAHYPEGALVFETIAAAKNDAEFQTAFNLPPAKAVMSLMGPSSAEIVTSTARSNLTQTFPNGRPEFPEKTFGETLGSMENDLTLSPGEYNLTKEHQDRLRENGGMINPDGSVSSLKVTSVEHDGKHYNIPTIWDGKEHTPQEAAKRAEQMGWETYPSYKTAKEAEDRYVRQMHPYLDKDGEAYKSYSDQRSKYYPKIEQWTPGSIPLSGAAGQYGEHYVFDKMKPTFRDKLATMAAAAKAEGVPFSVHSGFRSQEHQNSLFANSDGTGKWVAKHSHHTDGDAADLSGDLNWAHKNAERFGLHFPMSWEKWHVEEQGSRGQQKFSYSQGPVSSSSVANAIFGQESGWNPNIGKSVDGAQGIAQITPGTFKMFAQPGENINNPEHNARVGQRIIDHYMKKYNGDAARVAVAYFSGEGNVAPMGYATPYKNDRQDGNGKSVSGYVSDVMGRLYKDRSGFGANEGQYMPSMPDGPRPIGGEPLSTTFAGANSPVPISVDSAAANPYQLSEFVRSRVSDVRAEAAMLKSQLPGIESSLRNGIEYDQEQLASVLQFARSHPNEFPGVYDKLTKIAEASQIAWKMNGKDVFEYLRNADKMCVDSSCLRTKAIAGEVLEMNKSVAKMIKDDPWEYGVKSGASKAKPIEWVEALNPAGLGAENSGQVVTTAIEQRRKMGAALSNKIGVGGPLDYSFPKKDLDNLADLLDNADGQQAQSILGSLQQNINDPKEMAQMLANPNLRRSLFGQALSDDITRALPANKFLEKAHDMSPVLFTGHFGKMADQVNSFIHNTRYFSPKAAMQIRDTEGKSNSNDPGYQIKFREGTKNAAEITSKKVLNSLSSLAGDSYFHNSANDAPVTPDSLMAKSGQDALVSLYRQRYVAAYAAGNPDNAAKEIAGKYVSDSFQRSKFNGGRLLWNSPENVYAKDPEALSKFTMGFQKFVYEQSTKKGIMLDNGTPINPQMMAGSPGTFGIGAVPGAYLMSDKQTADDRLAMKNPTYMVQLKDSDGKWHLLTDEKQKPVRFGLPNADNKEQQFIPNLGSM